MITMTKTMKTLTAAVVTSGLMLTTNTMVTSIKEETTAVEGAVK